MSYDILWEEEKKMKHKINVTQKDIENGEPGNCQKCAVALAVQRKFPSKKIEVRAVENDNNGFEETKGGMIYIALDDKLYHFDDDIVNDKLYTFIDRFDGEYGVDPFEFELEVK